MDKEKEHMALGVRVTLLEMRMEIVETTVKKLLEIVEKMLQEKK